MHVIRQKIQRNAIIQMTKPFERPDVFNKRVTKSFERFNVSNERVTKSFERTDVSNGWGSHSNGLFLANGWPSRPICWHKRLVSGKPFENGKSLVYVLPCKVTNVKSLIMAVITRRFGWITLLHCTRKPCLCCMFMVARAYMQFSVSIKLKLIVRSVEQFLAGYIPHLSKEVEAGFALHHTRSLSLSY